MDIASTFTFSSLLPLVAAIFVYTLGFFVWIKNLRASISILFFLYCFAIATWLFGTFKLFNAQTQDAAVYWDRFIYLGVVFIPIFLYHFGLIYCRINRQKWLLVLGYPLAVFFLFASQTDLFVKDLFFYEWGVHTRAQILHHPFLVYFFSYFILFFINLWRFYVQSTGKQKLQARHLLIGFFILDAIGPLAFLPAYGISVYPIIFLSALPFVLLIAYAMVHYQALNVKILSVEIFSALVTILFLAEAFLSVTLGEMILRLIALGLVVFFVIMLLRSVHSEVHKREKIEHLQKQERIKTKEILKLKDEFVFIAAHELKAPVFAIKGFLEFVEQEKKIPKSVREYITNMHEASEHLSKLVNDLLQVARQEAGTMKIEPETLDVLPLIEEVVREQSVLGDKRAIRIEVRAKEHPSARVDRAKLKEVLTNLVSNAIKYNKEGGRVRVLVEPQARLLAISVADTGYGIPKDQQAKICGKFFRASGKATEGVLGTGLGLFITKMLIEKMGGKISFTSIENQGTTFTFTIPLASSV